MLGAQQPVTDSSMAQNCGARAARSAKEYNKVLDALETLSQASHGSGRVTLEGELVPEGGEVARLGALMSPQVRVGPRWLQPL